MFRPDLMLEIMMSFVLEMRRQRGRQAQCNQRRPRTQFLKRLFPNRQQLNRKYQCWNFAEIKLSINNSIGAENENSLALLIMVGMNLKFATLDPDVNQMDVCTMGIIGLNLKVKLLIFLYLLLIFYTTLCSLLNQQRMICLNFCCVDLF